MARKALPDEQIDPQARRLREARRARGYETGKAAALAHGWSVSFYGSNENGYRRLTINSATKYAKAFKVSVGWLLDGMGPGPNQRSVDAAMSGLPEDDREELYDLFMHAVQQRQARYKKQQK